MSEPTTSGLAALGTEAGSLLGEARAMEITVRVVGSTAIHMHCAPAAAAMERLGRGGKDIDLIVEGGDRKRLREMLETRGYEVDRDLLVAMEGARFSFSHPQTAVELDVFVDRLEFCHTIEVADRFHHHPATIPVEDLLLAKLQVHDLTRNDLLDAMVILATHPVAADAADPERIDADYVAGLLARDWGFHHTAMANLAAVEEALGGEPGGELGAPLAAAAGEGAAALREAVEAAKKSRAWRLRARIGERVQWWEDVDERVATY